MSSLLRNLNFLWQFIGQLLSSITTKFDIAQSSHWFMIELFFSSKPIVQASDSNMPNFWWQIAKFDTDREVGYVSALNWRLGFARVRVLSHDDIFGSNCWCKSDRCVSYPVTPTMRFCHWFEIKSVAYCEYQHLLCGIIASNWISHHPIVPIT